MCEGIPRAPAESRTEESGCSGHKPDCSTVPGNPSSSCWKMHGWRQLRKAGWREQVLPSKSFSRDRHGVDGLRDSSEDGEKSRRSCKGLGEGFMWLVGHWVLWEGDTCTGKGITERKEILGGISLGLKQKAEFLQHHKSQSTRQGKLWQEDLGTGQ